MAIAAGFTRPCSARSGGLKYVYLINKDDVTSMTLTTGVYTAITLESAKIFYKFEFEWDTAEVRQTWAKENGSLKVHQEIEFSLGGLTAAMRASLAPLAAQAASCGLIAVAQDVDGVKWVLGYGETFGKERPLLLIDGVDTTGKAIGDSKMSTIKLYCDTSELMYTTSASIVIA